MSKFMDELLAAAKIKRLKGEEDQVFYQRVARAIDGLDDDVYEGLTTTSQEWLNSAMLALKGKKDIPDIPGDEPEAKAKGKPKAKAAEPDDDEDDEPAPKAKAKGKAKVDPEPDDGEEDEPAPKSKGNAKAKPAAEPDDGEEDEPAPKAKAKAKAKPAAEPDDDDEPAPKAKGKAKGKPAAEDGEEDEPAPKSKGKAKAKDADAGGEGQPTPVKVRIKEILVDDVNLPAADIHKQMKKEGIKTTIGTVTAIRAQFRHTVRVLNAAKITKFPIS